MRSLRVALLSLVVAIGMGGNALALCNAGDAVSVLWKGKWYDAQVLQTTPQQCLVSYNGYDSSWDEWVGPDRYLLKHRSVSVLWKGKWYPAQVQRTRQNGYLVSYEGYDSSWDEWVDNNRISSRR